MIIPTVERKCSICCVVDVGSWARWCKKCAKKHFGVGE